MVDFIGRNRIIRCLIVTLVLLTAFARPGLAADYNVSDEAGLRQAVANATSGDIITITGDLTLTKPLVIDKKTLTLKGMGILSANVGLKDSNESVSNTLLIVKGGEVVVDGLTLDGKDVNRAIHATDAKLTLKGATITKGCPGGDASENPGGGVLLRGGSLTATDSHFSNNRPGTNATLSKPENAVSGAAIYTTDAETTIAIHGGSFTDNTVPAYGHGAAIYQAKGSLNIMGTAFSGNSGYLASDDQGTQGACVHIRQDVTATIKNVDVKVAKGFNTGGFLRSYAGTVDISGSKFTIDSLGDSYAISGGALCFEGGTSKVTNCEFTTTGSKSKVAYAGGFIDIVGTGTHTIESNKMTGYGIGNGKEIASFGGAISLEEKSGTGTDKPNLTIKNNKIDGISVSDNGGAIAIGTHRGKIIPADVTLSGNKITNVGTLYWGNRAGGGIFVGPEAKVTMSGDTLTASRSVLGGGIYNEGDLIISGGATLTGGMAAALGGEIYNDGLLTVDDATVTGDFVGGASWNMSPHPNKPNEYGGVNIYAARNVTITPKATLTAGKDLRVLDGQSMILLTGPLTKEIDVSISEASTKEGDSYPENISRKVGYVIAEGKNYTPAKGDAHFLHYIGKAKADEPSHYTNQVRAGFSDDTSIGEWDFVLSPQNKVVLGQRAELIFDGNGGTFDGQATDTKDYTFYSSEDPFADKTNMKAEKTPTKEGYQFVGWAADQKAAFESADAYLGANVNKFDDSKSYMSLQAKQTGPITDILNPYTTTVYALWVKQIDIPVNKVWGEGTKDEQKQEVKLTLTGGKAPVSLTLNEANGWSGKFEKVDTIAVNGGTDGKDAKITNYSVSEASINGFTSKTMGNATEGFTVTNTQIKETVDISVTKVWKDESGKDTTPTGVTATIKLLADGADAKKTLTFTGNETQKFEKLPKKNEQGAVITYTISEEPVSGYETPVTSGDATNGFTVTNKKTPETVDISVNKKWVDAEESDKVDVTVNLLANGQATEKAVTLNANNQWAGTFEDLAKNDENGDAITYTVTENAVEGFRSKVTGDVANGFTVTNTKINPIPEDKVNVQVTKVWSGAEESDKVPVTITLKTNGEATDKTVILNANNQWTGTFEGLPKNDENGNAITYTVSENAVKGFTSKVTGNVTDGFTITNTKNKPNPPTEKVITKYVDEQGNDLIKPKDGENPKENISGYKYVKTEKTTEGKETTIRHIYKKVERRSHGGGGSAFWNTKPVPDDGLLNKEDHKAYMFGYPDSTFLPNRNMTREEVTAMFARLLKDYPKERRSYVIPYNDVTASDWSYEAIGFMTEKGIVKGYEDGSFKPTEAISRAEFAAMAARFDKLVDGRGNPFFDVPDSHWALSSINSAAAKGWVSGYPDGSFKPERKITRSEVVSISNIMLDRFADKDFVRNHLGEMIEFTDLTEVNWAYFPIMEATNGHDYTRKAAEKEEDWSRLNGEEFRFPLLYRK
ncbi:Cna B-type domain-containing protein [Peptococcus niger]|uniref:Surface protein repeat SSSPR-51 n=1 Tax=Peptococcus niger TaxID=2741 RepID=A0A1G6WEJ4_PEPNI|nr:Cna B-type domain-containing protein [Peptococcus niger]SDD64219.1 surface protein repeat SSSPR-51 [Peptococcus niger]